MGRSWAWYFDVKVTYKYPDPRGKVRTWTANERITGIGTASTTEDEARAIADRLLATDDRVRRSILGKYPEGATAKLSPKGHLYEQFLPGW